MFRELKAAAVTSFFIDKTGEDQINDIDLMKLSVFAERICLDRYTTQMIGDVFVNMPFGPVLSGMYHRMNYRFDEGIWSSFFEPMEQYTIKRKESVAFDEVLADWEIAILQEVWDQHGDSVKWDKVRYAHSENVPEWKMPTPPRRQEPLPLQDVFEIGLGYSHDVAATKSNLVKNVESARKRFS